MHQHPDSPPSNTLGAGITEDDLTRAIEQSGYPLQSQVVDTILAELRPENASFAIQEEWSYEDEDQDQVRQLDALVACRWNTDTDHKEWGRPEDPAEYLRGSLDFLIECKQSELPFVFFVRPVGLSDTPTVAGIPHEDLEIRSAPDVKGQVAMSMTDALGLYALPLANHDLTAIAMTRVYRKKGGQLELSGEEAFRGLALPLLKAQSYYLRKTEPRSEHLYFTVRTVVALAVLRAPIVAVRMEDGEPRLESVPWVRVARTEPGDESFRTDLPAGVRSFDVVHVDFLPEYLAKAVETSKELTHRARDFAVQVLTGIAHWGDSSNGDEEPTPDDDAEGDAVDEDPPYRTLYPHIVGSDLADWISKRWADAHGHGDDAGPTMHIAAVPAREVEPT